jgi:hypothetical protein
LDGKDFLLPLEPSGAEDHYPAVLLRVTKKIPRETMGRPTMTPWKSIISVWNNLSPVLKQ